MVGSPIAMMPSMQKDSTVSQRGFAGGKALKYILIKMQLEFCIDVLKDFFQHGVFLQ